MLAVVISNAPLTTSDLVQVIEMCLSRRRRRGQCQEIFVPTLNRQIPASLGARIVSASELGNSGRADYADCRPRPNRQSPIATPRNANEEGSGSCSGASAVEPIVKPYHNSGVSVQEMELIEPMNCTTPLPSRPLTVLPATVMASPPYFKFDPPTTKVGAALIKLNDAVTLGDPRLHIAITGSTTGEEKVRVSISV